MSCKKCNENPDCFNDTPKCDEGCEEILSTDCIFHNIQNTDQSAKLPNIGVEKGSSLKYILKQIDGKLELLLTTDFSSFDMNDIGKVNNIKQFSELITSKIKLLLEADEDTIKALTEISGMLATLATSLNKVININLSNSTLDINSTDELKEVLVKIISYIESVETTSLQIEDTSSVNLLYLNKTLSADLKVSQQDGNIITILEDGVFASNPSIKNLISSIKSNPGLLTMFNDLIKPSGFEYNVMSEIVTPIKYINTQGEEIVVTAQANKLLKIRDVKRIISIPTKETIITNKGIQDEL